MYSTEQKSKIVTVFGRCLRMLLILGSIVICIEACSKDEEEIKKDPPPKENPPGEGNQGGGQDTIVAPADSLDADVVSEHLLLANASRITGVPPTAPDGQIKMDVKDTIFVVKGLPIGETITFWHGAAQDVTGFYVYVPGASFYYDVPETVIDDKFIPNAENDTISLLTLDISADEWEFPFSTDVQILPHGPDGIPLDDSTRPVGDEDPAKSCNSILRGPINSGGPISGNSWLWEKTTLSYNGIVTNTWAPWVLVGIQSIGAGCCWTSRNSSVYVGYPGCRKNNPSPQMAYKELPLDANVKRFWEVLEMTEDGEFIVTADEYKKEWDMDNSNFCSEIPAYKLKNNLLGFGDGGTHDFVPGVTSMNIPVPNWVGSWHPPAHVDLIYTCNTLIMKWGDAEGAQWLKAYKNSKLHNGFKLPSRNDLWFD